MEGHPHPITYVVVYVLALALPIALAARELTGYSRRASPPRNASAPADVQLVFPFTHVIVPIVEELTTPSETSPTKI